MFFLIIGLDSLVKPENDSFSPTILYYVLRSTGSKNPISNLLQYNSLKIYFKTKKGETSVRLETIRIMGSVLYSNLPLSNKSLFKNTDKLSCHWGSVIPKAFWILSLLKTEYAGRFAGVGYSSVVQEFTTQSLFWR